MVNYGTVLRLEALQGFGFLRDDSQQDWFFVRDGVRDPGFEALWVGERVGFDKGWTRNGPVASTSTTSNSIDPAAAPLRHRRHARADRRRRQAGDDPRLRGDVRRAASARAHPVVGRTDEFIFSRALELAGVAANDAQARDFRARYVAYLEDEIQHPGTGHHGPLPGVEALLEVLDALPDVHLALLTGNYRDGARIKLGHFGLWDRFAWGAFGDDAADRNALVPIALARAAEREVPVPPPQHVVVIGDTRFDIECAKAGGVRAIGVATGDTPAAHLRDAGADLVVDDLTAVDRVLDFLALEPTAR